MLVLIFLVSQLLRKRPDFSSGFYVLFVILCAYNILSLLLNYAGGRVPKFGWFTSFYVIDHFVARANIVGDTFFTHYRNNAGLFLAANRLFALAFPKLYSVVWTGRSLKLIIVVNHLLPLAMTSVAVPIDAYYAHFNGSSNVLELVTGEDAGSCFFEEVTSTGSKFLYGAYPAMIGLGVSLLTFILELTLLFSIRRFMRKLGASVSDKQRDDVRLAFFTIVAFALNLALLASAISQRILGYNTRSTLMEILIAISYWSYDIQCLSPPIILVVISKTLRQELVLFLRAPSTGPRDDADCANNVYQS